MLKLSRGCRGQLIALLHHLVHMLSDRYSTQWKAIGQVRSQIFCDWGVLHGSHWGHCCFNCEVHGNPHWSKCIGHFPFAFKPSLMTGLKVLLGLASGVQSSYALLVGEICPNKYKWLGIMFVIVLAPIPTGFGNYLGEQPLLFGLTCSMYTF